MNIPPDVIETMAAGIGQAYADHSENAAHEAARAALSALADSGWVVVPKEPTEAMRIAGARRRTTLQIGSSAISGEIGRWCASDVYDAMIEAALPTKDTSHG